MRAVRWHLALPALLTAGLAFRAGGFFAGTTAMLAVALALALLVRVTVGRTPFAGWSPAVAVVAGALALLGVWTLLSSIWSDAPFRALSEFDRVLAYVLVLALMGSFATRAGDLDRVLRALGLVIWAVATAALLTRLAPDVFPAAAGKAPARLAFPVTYWNSLGVLCGVGLTFVLHCLAGARQGPAVRVLAAGAAPVLAASLYFTFSRGGIAAAALGCLAYVVLAHPRRLPIALLAAGVPTVVAVRTVYGAERLATKDFAAATADGHRVLMVVGACSVAAMALRALGVLVDRRLDAVTLPPRMRLAALGTLAGVVLAATVFAGVATALPERLEEQRAAFVRTGPINEAEDQRGRLGQVGANGRIEHWRVSLRAFADHPLVGTGAGTYRLEWERERETEFSVVDGHSLYFEVLGELGWPGLVAVALALLVPLVVAARRLGGAERHAHGAFLAAALALLVHAGVDWDWEMPAVFLWLPATAGVVCAARARDDRTERAGPGRLPRILAGLGCLVVALGPASLAISQRALDRATADFRAGDCAGAVDAALDSLEALRARPEPFELLGYCNLRAGRSGLALAAMRAARDRDPHDWQYAYGTAVAQAFAGEDPRASAARALQLNPLDARARELDAALRRGDPRRWPRIAANASIPYQ
ncbi:MAG: O-antigen ligase family protein [Solirubrobacteraceae bacterium]